MFRDSLVESLFKQLTNTEHKVAGCWAAENIIWQLMERNFIHKVPPSGKEINTAEEVRSMCVHQTWTEVLLSAV
jgi:hypothetical protein